MKWSYSTLDIFIWNVLHWINVLIVFAEGSETATRLDMIGYLVSNCPFQAKSISDYYIFISEQVFDFCY